MKKKQKCIILTVLVVFLFTGCSSRFKKDEQREKVKEEYIPVEVEKVFSGEIYNGISFGGRFSSLKDGVVFPSIPGVVKSIVVKPGDKVSKGDLLFTLENEEDGNSLIIVEFNSGTDMDFASLEMREKIDLVKGFLPDEVENPMVIKVDPNAMPIMQLSFYSEEDLGKL